MKNLLFTAFLVLNGVLSFGQNSFQKANFSADCSNDFFTIRATGHIQQWSLNGGVINGGDTILSGGGQSLGYSGDIDSPTFYTDNWNPGEIGINYYDEDSGWLNIPTLFNVQDNGGHLNDQYYTVVGAIIQYVNYWDGTSLQVIDSLPGEFFAGIFDIAVNTQGQAWITTSSTPGTTIDSLKVYDQNGQINSYAFQYDILGYGSFFLNDTLYLGSNQDSIYPVLINGNQAQLGTGIFFEASNFTDMASCQFSDVTSAIISRRNQNVNLFPNPTRGYITLPLNNEQLNVSVYNFKGQLIEHKLNGDYLDLREQPEGVYYIKLSGADGPIISKVLKL